MVYVKEGSGSWTLYNIGRDYLGSVTHVATADGTLVAEYSYDAWGRMRNPVTLTVYGWDAQPELFTGRGYTGHEHLPDFGLVNMNARIYDPLLGRFLSPDPYVTDATSTQAFNRYSYALNNPLRYTDESGELAGIDDAILIGAGLAALFGLGNVAAHHIRGDDLGKGQWAKYFFSGAAAGALLGLTGVSISAMASMSGFVGKVGGFLEGLKKVAAVSFFTSTAAGLVGGTMKSGFKGVVNSSKIFLGNFYLDENNSFFQAIWQGYSRHTFEVLQTSLGYGYSQMRNATGYIERVDYYGGATFATHEESTHYRGMTLGNFINIDRPGKINEPFDYFIEREDQLFAHEYGHTIQSRRFGILYPFLALLSLGSQIVDNMNICDYEHDYFFTEVMANRYSTPLFPRYVWGIKDYPIVY